MGNNEHKNFIEVIVKKIKETSEAAKDIRIANNPGYEEKDKGKSMQRAGQTRVPNNTSTGR